MSTATETAATLKQLRARLAHHRDEANDALSPLAPSSTERVLRLLDLAEIALDDAKLHQTKGLLDEAAEMLHG